MHLNGKQIQTLIASQIKYRKYMNSTDEMQKVDEKMVNDKMNKMSELWHDYVSCLKCSYV